jgi:peptidoglycan biosynthesis protein MviN/MurJ (putative lipid II flippase)
VIAAIAGAVNIGANLVLVPVLGIAGAGLATVVAYAILAAMQLLALPDRREWRGPGARIVLTTLAALVVAAASLLLPQDVLWNWVRIAGVVACLPWFLRRLKTARGGVS